MFKDHVPLATSFDGIQQGEMRDILQDIEENDSLISQL